MAATQTNYGSIETITDADLAEVMAILKGRPPSDILAFFYDATNTLYVCIAKTHQDA